MKVFKGMRSSRSWVLYLFATGIVAIGILFLTFSSSFGRGNTPQPMFSEITSPSMAEAAVHSQGACWGDYDGDGDQDLFVANFMRRKDETNHLWRNDGAGHFEDVGSAAGVASQTFRGAVGCAFVDVDNDGDPDLHVTANGSREGGPDTQESRLFRNDGNGTFTDMTATSGVGMRGFGATSADWADYDGDGDYDVFAAVRDRNGLNGFFEQTGPFSFTNVAAAKGLADPTGPQLAYLGSWFDYDGDGDVDLLLAIDWWGVELFRNDAGTFTRVTISALPAATDTTPGAPPNNPMGVTWGDYNGDGCVDVFISGLNIPGHGGFGDQVLTADSPSRLYRNNCNGTFSDDTRTTGFIATGLVEWSANFVDFDNDGDLDLSVVAANVEVPEALGRPSRSSRRLISFVVTRLRRIIPPRVVAWAYRYEAMIPSSGTTGPAAAMPHSIYRNQLVETGSATYVNATYELGVGDVGASRGAAWADMDGDGDLDWFIPGRGTPNRLFRNDGPVGHYLRLHMIGSPLRDAVGAWVKIKVGNRYQQRHVHVLDGYLSQSQMDPHFGLGEVATVDEVWVRWPGTTTWILTCKAVPANRMLTVTQGGGCRVE